jgi:hypothetical protein
MGRSPGFGSARRNWAPFRTRFPCGSGCRCLNLATSNHSSAHSTKGTPSPKLALRLRQAGGTRFQDLFHSPCRGAFHHSLTVLVHYRSLVVFSLGQWSAPLPTRFRVSGGTHETSPQRRCARRLRGSHPLWPPVPAGFGCTHRGAASGLLPAPTGPSNPRSAAPAGSYADPVWALPRSLAATEGILSAPRGTEMFQFPRFPSGVRRMTGYHPRRVAPFGDPGIAGCQRLPRAFRRVATSFLGNQRQGIHRVPIISAYTPGAHRASFPPGMQDLLPEVCTGPLVGIPVRFVSCAWDGSHASWFVKVPSVEPRGLEPRTSAVQGRRSPS